VELRPAALKALRRIGRKDRDRIGRSIDLLPAGDVRQLVGRPGEWRCRVGDWRVRYRLDWEEGVVDVLAVSPRGSAYKP
jgi:mRNA interferase RelE/StbE